jgi:hypothetical protein
MAAADSATFSDTALSTSPAASDVWVTTKRSRSSERTENFDFIGNLRDFGGTREEWFFEPRGWRLVVYDKT